jgi:hypothetical protein
MDIVHHILMAVFLTWMVVAIIQPTLGGFVSVIHAVAGVGTLIVAWTTKLDPDARMGKPAEITLRISTIFFQWLIYQGLLVLHGSDVVDDPEVLFWLLVAFTLTCYLNITIDRVQKMAPSGLH